MQISLLSREINALPSSSEGSTDNNIDNPKNESCKVVETSFEVITKKGEDEIVEEGLKKKKEVRIEKKDSRKEESPLRN